MALENPKRPQAEAWATFYRQHGGIGGTGFSLLRPFSAACWFRSSEYVFDIILSTYHNPTWVGCSDWRRVRTGVFRASRME
jgi:hypothetical protein